MLLRHIKQLNEDIKQLNEDIKQLNEDIKQLNEDIKQPLKYWLLYLSRVILLIQGI